MIVTIQYYMVVKGKKLVVDTPEGFPTVLDISKFAQQGEGVAIARTMGDYMRDKKSKLPTGILFEKESRPK